MLLAMASNVASQKLTQAERRARLDSVLTARYFRSPYDTNYVIRPEGKLTLKVRFNQTGNDFHAKGTVNDIYSKADLKTSHKTTMSIGASYRGISAAVAVNPGKLKGIYKVLRALDASYLVIDRLIPEARIDDDRADNQSGRLQQLMTAISHVYHSLHCGDVLRIFLQIQKLTQLKVL